MPMSCVAPNCTGRYRRGTKVGYFRIPSDYKRKQLWLKALRKDSWEPKSYHRVCGAHFVSGRPSLDPNDVDFVPNVFSVTPKRDEPLLAIPVLKDFPPPKGKKPREEQPSPFNLLIAGNNNKPDNQPLVAVKPSVVKDIQTNMVPFQPKLIHKPVIDTSSLDDRRDLRPRFISTSTQTLPLSSLFLNTVKHQPNHVVFLDKS